MRQTRSESEIIQQAAVYKSALVRRAAKICELVQTISLAQAGLAPDVKPARLETMISQLDSLSGKQSQDTFIYATLRWVLGVTQEIDLTNLELDK